MRDMPGKIQAVQGSRKQKKRRAAADALDGVTVCAKCGKAPPMPPHRTCGTVLQKLHAKQSKDADAQGR